MALAESISASQTSDLITAAQNATDIISQQTIADQDLEQMLAQQMAAQLQVTSDISSQFYNQIADQQAQAATSNPV